VREVLVCGSVGALFMTLYPAQIREWEVLGTGLFNFLFNIACITRLNHTISTAISAAISRYGIAFLAAGWAVKKINGFASD